MALSVKKSSCSRLIFVGTLFAAMFFAIVCNPQEPAKKEGEPITISSDSLEIDNLKKYAEFAGNVKANQGETKITSDRLRIYYKAGEDGKQTPEENSIDKIVAEGNVIILFDGNTAKTQKAEYTTADRVLVLSGQGSTMTGEKGSLTGSKITIKRDSEHTKVDGPVKAEVHSDGKGID